MADKKLKAKNKRKKSGNVFLKKYSRLLILLAVFMLLATFGVVTKTFVKSSSPEEQRTKILATNYFEGIKTCDAKKYTLAESDYLYGDGEVPIVVLEQDAEKIKQVCGQLKSYEYITGSTLNSKDGAYMIAQDFKVRAQEDGKDVTLVSRIIAIGNNKDGWHLSPAPNFPTSEENYKKLK